MDECSINSNLWVPNHSTRYSDDDLLSKLGMDPSPVRRFCKSMNENTNQYIRSQFSSESIIEALGGSKVCVDGDLVLIFRDGQLSLTNTLIEKQLLVSIPSNIKSLTNLTLSEKLGLVSFMYISNRILFECIFNFSTIPFKRCARPISFFSSFFNHKQISQELCNSQSVTNIIAETLVISENTKLVITTGLPSRYSGEATEVHFRDVENLHCGEIKDDWIIDAAATSNQYDEAKFALHDSMSRAYITGNCDADKYILSTSESSITQSIHDARPLAGVTDSVASNRMQRAGTLSNTQPFADRINGPPGSILAAMEPGTRAGLSVLNLAPSAWLEGQIFDLGLKWIDSSWSPMLEAAVKRQKREVEATEDISVALTLQAEVIDFLSKDNDDKQLSSDFDTNLLQKNVTNEKSEELPHRSKDFPAESPFVDLDGSSDSDVVSISSSGSDGEKSNDENCGSEGKKMARKEFAASIASIYSDVYQSFNSFTGVLYSLRVRRRAMRRMLKRTLLKKISWVEACIFALLYAVGRLTRIRITEQSSSQNQSNKQKQLEDEDLWTSLQGGFAILESNLWRTRNLHCSEIIIGASIMSRLSQEDRCELFSSIVDTATLMHSAVLAARQCTQPLSLAPERPLPTSLLQMRTFLDHHVSSDIILSPEAPKGTETLLNVWRQVKSKQQEGSQTIAKAIETVKALKTLSAHRLKVTEALANETFARTSAKIRRLEARHKVRRDIIMYYIQRQKTLTTTSKNMQPAQSLEDLLKALDASHEARLALIDPARRATPGHGFSLVTSKMVWLSCSMRLKAAMEALVRKVDDVREDMLMSLVGSKLSGTNGVTADGVGGVSGSEYVISPELVEKLAQVHKLLSSSSANTTNIPHDSLNKTIYNNASSKSKSKSKRARSDALELAASTLFPNCPEGVVEALLRIGAFLEDLKADLSFPLQSNFNHALIQKYLLQSKSDHNNEKQAALIASMALLMPSSTVIHKDDNTQNNCEASTATPPTIFFHAFLLNSSQIVDDSFLVSPYPVAAMPANLLLPSLNASWSLSIRSFSENNMIGREMSFAFLLQSSKTEGSQAFVGTGIVTAEGGADKRLSLCSHVASFCQASCPSLELEEEEAKKLLRKGFFHRVKKFRNFVRIVTEKSRTSASSSAPSLSYSAPTRCPLCNNKSSCDRRICMRMRTTAFSRHPFFAKIVGTQLDASLGLGRLVEERQIHVASCMISTCKGELAVLSVFNCFLPEPASRAGLDCVTRGGVVRVFLRPIRKHFAIQKNVAIERLQEARKDGVSFEDRMTVEGNEVISGVDPAWPQFEVWSSPMSLLGGFVQAILSPSASRKVTHHAGVSHRSTNGGWSLLDFEGGGGSLVDVNGDDEMGLHLSNGDTIMLGRKYFPAMDYIDSNAGKSINAEHQELLSKQVTATDVSKEVTIGEGSSSCATRPSSSQTRSETRNVSSDAESSINKKINELQIPKAHEPWVEENGNLVSKLIKRANHHCAGIWPLCEPISDPVDLNDKQPRRTNTDEFGRPLPRILTGDTSIHFLNAPALFVPDLFSNDFWTTARSKKIDINWQDVMSPHFTVECTSPVLNASVWSNPKLLNGLLDDFDSNSSKVGENSSSSQKEQKLESEILSDFSSDEDEFTCQVEEKERFWIQKLIEESKSYNVNIPSLQQHFNQEFELRSQNEEDEILAGVSSLIEPCETDDTAEEILENATCLLAGALPDLPIRYPRRRPVQDRISIHVNGSFKPSCDIESFPHALRTEWNSAEPKNGILNGIDNWGSLLLKHSDTACADLYNKFTHIVGGTLSTSNNHTSVSSVSAAPLPSSSDDANQIILQIVRHTQLMKSADSAAQEYNNGAFHGAY